VPAAPISLGGRLATRRGFVEILAAVAAIFVIGAVVFALGRVTAPPAGPAVAFPGGMVPGRGGGFPGGMMPGQDGQPGQRGRGNFQPGQRGRGNFMPGQPGQPGQPGRGLPGNGGDQGGFGRMGGFPGGAGLTLKGEVVDVAADHLTLKLDSGRTVQIGLDSSTTYHGQAPASAGDVAKGSQVVVELGPRGAGAGGTWRDRLGGASDVTIVKP
jgi:hypothetical protein